MQHIEDTHRVPLVSHLDEEATPYEEDLGYNHHYGHGDAHAAYESEVEWQTVPRQHHEYRSEHHGRTVYGEEYDHRLSEPLYYPSHHEERVYRHEEVVHPRVEYRRHARDPAVYSHSYFHKVPIVHETVRHEVPVVHESVHYEVPVLHERVHHEVPVVHETILHELPVHHEVPVHRESLLHETVRHDIPVHHEATVLHESVLHEMPHHVAYTTVPTHYRDLGHFGHETVTHHIDHETHHSLDHAYDD